MENYKISDKDKKLYKMFLTAEDIEVAGLEANVGSSTVYNIISQRQAVNKKTEKVISALNVILYINLCAILPALSAEITSLSEKDEVKDYINSLIVVF